MSRSASALRRFAHLGPWLLSLASVAVVVARVAYRWRFGVDFTDEGFYAALPHRFVAGDRPFIDEIMVQQTAGLLLLPGVAVYHALFGTTGVVLGFRLAYLAILGLVSLVVVRLALRRGSGAVALLLGAVIFEAGTVDGASLSYNTLALAFSTLSFALLVDADASKGRAFLGGVAFSAAVIAYPPIGAIVPLLLTVMRRAIKPLAVGIASLLVPFGLYLLFGVGLEVAVDSVRTYATLVPKGGGASKVMLLWSQLRAIVSPIGLGVGVGTAIVCRKKAPEFAVAGAIVFSGLSLFRLSATAAPVTLDFAVGIVVVTTLAGPIAACALLKAPAVQAVLMRMWVPSVAAAIVTAYTSDIGIPAARVGIFAAFCASLVLFAMAFGKCVRVLAWARWAAFGALALTFDATSYRNVYRDRPLTQLDTRVTSGPYAGLYTSKAKADLVVEIEDAIGKLDSRSRIVVLNDFPGGYLMTGLRQATCGVWVYSTPIRPDGSYRLPYVKCLERPRTESVYALMLRIDSRSPDLVPAPVVHLDPLESRIRSCTRASLSSSAAFELLSLDQECLAAGN